MSLINFSNKKSNQFVNSDHFKHCLKNSNTQNGALQKRYTEKENEMKKSVFAILIMLFIAFSVNAADGMLNVESEFSVE